MQILARNEVAHWRKEKINTLSMPNLRHVPANAERPKETEVAALYDELLVYGKRLQGSLPEEKAISVDEVDAETVRNLRIETRAEEYGATWTEKKRVIVRSTG